jgi:hypothetical protein
MELITGEIVCSPTHWRARGEKENVRSSAKVGIYQRMPGGDVSAEGPNPLGVLTYLSAYKTDDGPEPSAIFLTVDLPTSDFCTLWASALSQIVFGEPETKTARAFDTSAASRLQAPAPFEQRTVAAGLCGGRQPEHFNNNNSKPARSRKARSSGATVHGQRPHALAARTGGCVPRR